MENRMKRAISAFLALVLVLGMLPGVPLFAGAEEVVSLPETVAVETTEAVTEAPETEAPETTVAPETENPETIPETESAPAETEPQETLVEETVPEETLPQETVPAQTEEVPVEETLGEVSGEAADANDPIVYPTRLKASAEKTETYLGNDVKLSVEFTPATTTEKEVWWIVARVYTDAEGGKTYDEVWRGGAAEVDAAADIYVGEAIATGEPYLRVRYNSGADNSGTYAAFAYPYAVDEDGNKTMDESIVAESKPAEVTFYNYAMEINEKAMVDYLPKDETGNPDTDSEYYVLQTGESMEISVAYKRWAEDQEPSIELPLHAPSQVNWKMEVLAVDEDGNFVIGEDGEYVTTGEAFDKYASLTVSEDTKSASLSAKLVTEYKGLRITATETVGVVNLGGSSILVRLYPDSYKIHITKTLDEYGNIMEKDVTNDVITVDIAKFEAENGPHEDIRITLNAGIWPVEGDEKLVWSCSDALVELEDPDEEDDWNKEMVLLLDHRSGKTEITVCGKDHPSIAATVIINRARLIQKIEPSKASKELQTKELLAGKSAKLEAVSYVDREIVDNSLLKWEIAEGDEAYASIDAQGVLTAKNVTEGKVITVTCTVIGKEEAVENGDEDAFFALYIPIRPLATGVNIYGDTFLFEDADCDRIVNGETLTVDTNKYEKSIPSFRVETYANDYNSVGDPVGARQEVTWKSSNTSVADFDKLTDELVWKGKNGTTTITATAKDGSGKSASVTLKFGARLIDVRIEGTEDMFLRSGSSWTFGLTCIPENAMNKDVIWSVELEEDYGVDISSVATINANGKLTAKNVYDNYWVKVKAVSKENPEIWDEFGVIICPKQERVLTILDGDKCVNKTTIQLDVGADVSLDARYVVSDPVSDWFGYDYDDISWKSSTPLVASVDDYGYVYAWKVGTAKLTATGPDKKTATVTIKVVSQVDEIEIAEKKYPDNYEGVLAVGKSLDMKATVIDYATMDENGRYPNGRPTVSKVTWHIAPGGEEFATISASGKVTARKDIDMRKLPANIEVYARATDGSDKESDYYSITIYPATESIRIDIDQSDKTTGSYTHYLSDPGEYGEAVGTLTAKIFPDETYPAAAFCDRVSWKSSNPKVAEVDGDGNVTAYKTGSVTITATAIDGTNKSATFKLKIVAKAQYVVVNNWNKLVYDKELEEWGYVFNNDCNMVYDEDLQEWVFAIGGGKSAALKLEFYDYTGKRVTVPMDWSEGIVDIGYGTAFVTSFRNGKISTARVTEPKFTTATVKVPAKAISEEFGDADDEGYVHMTIKVGVYPITTGMEIVEVTDNGNRSTNEIWKKAGDSVELSVLTGPKNAAQGWVWKSSNEKIAKVEMRWNEETESFEYVVVATEQKDGSYRSGTVTITATAKDGSGKKDTIKIIYAK